MDDAFRRKINAPSTTATDPTAPNTMNKTTLPLSEDVKRPPLLAVELLPAALTGFLFSESGALEEWVGCGDSVMGGSDAITAAGGKGVAGSVRVGSGALVVGSSPASGSRG